MRQLELGVPDKKFVMFDTERVRQMMEEEDRSLALTLDDLDVSVRELIVQSKQDKSATEAKGEGTHGIGDDTPEEASGSTEITSFQGER